jgi:hypothetical protein
MKFPNDNIDSSLDCLAGKVTPTSDYITKYLLFSIPVNVVLFGLTAWTIPLNVKSDLYIHDDEVSRGMLYKKNLKYFPLVSLI